MYVNSQERIHQFFLPPLRLLKKSQPPPSTARAVHLWQYAATSLAFEQHCDPIFGKKTTGEIGPQILGEKWGFQVSHVQFQQSGFAICSCPQTWKKNKWRFDASFSASFRQWCFQVTPKRDMNLSNTVILTEYPTILGQFLPSQVVSWMSESSTATTYYHLPPTINKTPKPCLASGFLPIWATFKTLTTFHWSWEVNRASYFGFHMDVSKNSGTPKSSIKK